MSGIDDVKRRRFLKMTAASAGGLAVSVLPPSLRQALATPAATVTGTIQDVQHVVVFMQENRAFDHYFGSLAGVRGFGDRAPAPLPGGTNNVWQQPYGSGHMLPFHMDTRTTSGICINAPAMSYPLDTAIWNNGRFDAWNPARAPGPGTGYFTRADLPSSLPPAR